MAKIEKYTVCCHDCGSDLVIDAATGQVLSHRTAKKAAPTKDFDTLLAGIDDAKSRADTLFQQELEALDDRDRLMEEKFREALSRAETEDDGKPPVRPWDLD